MYTSSGPTLTRGSRYHRAAPPDQTLAHNSVIRESDPASRKVHSGSRPILRDGQVGHRCRQQQEHDAIQKRPRTCRDSWSTWVSAENQAATIGAAAYPRAIEFRRQDTQNSGPTVEFASEIKQTSREIGLEVVSELVSTTSCHSSSKLTIALLRRRSDVMTGPRNGGSGPLPLSIDQPEDHPLPSPVGAVDPREQAANEQPDAEQPDHDANRQHDHRHTKPEPDDHHDQTENDSGRVLEKPADT